MAPEAKTIREKLRASTLGRSTRKTRIISIDGPDGPLEVEVRSPSIAARQRAQDAGRIEVSAENNVPKVTMGAVNHYSIELMIECVYVPSTGQKLFEPADREALLDESMSGWLAELSNAMLAAHKEMADEAPKGSGSTDSASSSASSASV